MLPYYNTDIAMQLVWKIIIIFLDCVVLTPKKVTIIVTFFGKMDTKVFPLNGQPGKTVVNGY